MECLFYRRQKRARLHEQEGASRASVTLLIATAAFALLAFQAAIASGLGSRAVDPGVRGGAPGAGDPIDGLTMREGDFFDAGKDEFVEVEEIDEGLGPRLNLDSCDGCHSQPATGGTSPAVNPQVAFADKDGGTDAVPPFLSLHGPVREARFVLNRDGSPDGGVHALFTISGRTGAEPCMIRQPDFARQLSNRNVIFRIPTPAFGAGLIEQISDSAILANQNANSSLKVALGIRGRPNYHVSGRTVTGQTNNNGNDGTIARLGWKAQNKSLLLFSGEAYNVEMGISNELFQTEREEDRDCQFAPVPNSITDPEADSPTDALSAIEKFAFFMRFLAPPVQALPPGVSAQSVADGRRAFDNVGCAYCHTPGFRTGNSAVGALNDKPVNLFSDLLTHDMGVGLADGVSQGEAGPREFRSAPLWGLGQRIFFLHDGRTSDLITAIRAHASPGSEANGVVLNYMALSEARKQDLLNFLRSL